MKTKQLLAAAVVGALVLAACGDDDSGDGAEANEYSEALAEVMRAEQDDLPLEDSDVDCLSVELIDALGGPEELAEAGVTPEDISESEDVSDLDLDVTDEQAEEIANSFDDCGISLRDLILESAGEEIPEEVKECVADALDEDQLAEFFAQTITGGESGDELPPEIMESMFACFGG